MSKRATSPQSHEQAPGARETAGSEPAVWVVGAAIVEAGRCLVAQRGAGMSSPWLWEFPGGKVEPGEDPRQALAREIREELGLEIEVGPWLGRGASRVGGRRIELEVFLARPRGGTLRLAEHHACRWVSPAELETLQWADADLPILPACKTVLERGGSRAACGSTTASLPPNRVSPLDKSGSPT